MGISIEKLFLERRYLGILIIKEKKHMSIKIVTDSGADLLALDGVAFASAPLTIM